LLAPQSNQALTEQRRLRKAKLKRQRVVLSPEQSLSLHGGNRAVPHQLLVRTPKGGNKPTNLLHGTSIFDMRLNMPREHDVIEQQGLRLFSLPAALIAAQQYSYN
jgi:hypothetical protein